MWQLGGIQLHAYGLIIGLAILLGYFLVEKKAHQLKWSTHFLERSFWLVVLGGILGARLYHVLSDFHLYQDQVVNALKIWNGGLSIIGAVLGAAITLILITRWQKPDHSWVAYLDLAVFGLPFAQAVGRWANFVNQELYGLPTTLPWGIYIRPENRLPGWESFTLFHPLFAYEMILMIIFGLASWGLADYFSQRQATRIGSGWYFYAYVVYYSLIRVILDFLRLDKQVTPFLGLGSNQVVLLLLLVIMGIAGLYRWRRQREV